MGCPEFEYEVHRHAEGTLPAGRLTRVVEHLAACPECREQARQLQTLDVALSRELERPKLAAGFNARLWQRIDTEALATVSDPILAERRCRLAAEYEAGARRLTRKSPWFTAVLDGLGFGMLAGGFGYAVARYGPEVLRVSFGSADAWVRSVPAGLAALVLAAVVAVALGWKPAVRRRWGLF